MFRFGFEAMVYSQYQNNPITFNGAPYYPIGINYNFQIDFWLDLVLMAVIAVVIRIVALLVMYKISDPKIMPLLPVEENQLDDRKTP
jgi:NhaP-type Na+/H+ or K+/H+ antiporter